MTMEDHSEIWLFAYGSLMWHPDFAFAEMQPAAVYGYHRAFCVYSWVYRGTPERPGLVLGLDYGGICRGVAYRLHPEKRAAILAAVDAREQVTGVYRPVTARIRLDNGRRVNARAYVADRGHAQYAGRLSVSAEAALIREAAGISGPNIDYARNTVAHLRALNIQDSRLEALARLLDAPPPA